MRSNKHRGINPTGQSLSVIEAADIPIIKNTFPGGQCGHPVIPAAIVQEIVIRVTVLTHKTGAIAHNADYRLGSQLHQQP